MMETKVVYRNVCGREEHLFEPFWIVLVDWNVYNAAPVIHAVDAKFRIYKKPPW